MSYRASKREEETLSKHIDSSLLTPLLKHFYFTPSYTETPVKIHHDQIGRNVVFPLNWPSQLLYVDHCIIIFILANHMNPIIMK